MKTKNLIAWVDDEKQKVTVKIDEDEGYVIFETESVEFKFDLVDIENLLQLMSKDMGSG